jgi:Predicted membrane protein
MRTVKHGGVFASPSIPPRQVLFLGLLLALLLLAQVNQPYPAIAPLQHLPTALLLIAAPWLLGRWPLSTPAFACIILFLALHTLGGRYVYSNVPYDAWSRALTGRGLSEAFGWTRNHYDRFVHFSFGLLSMSPVMEIARRYGGLSRRGAVLAAAGWVLSLSCLYEIFEWLLTIVAAGETADRYNGQQGDIWDAQKDMALAALGALLIGALSRALRRHGGDGLASRPARPE